MNKLLEDWSEDVLEYLTQFSWIDEDVAEEIIKIAKERIPVGKVTRVLDATGNLVFDSLKNDKNIQRFLADNPDFGEPTGDEYRSNKSSIDAMFGELESYINNVVKSLNLAKRYQADLSPSFRELETPKVTVENWDCYLWLIEVEFPKTGITISNQYRAELQSVGSSRIGVDLSLKAKLGDMTYYTINLEDGMGDSAEWAYGSDTRISEIVEKMSNNLREAIRVLKLRDLIEPLVRNENQFVETVKAMYKVRNMK